MSHENKVTSGHQMNVEDIQKFISSSQAMTQLMPKDQQTQALMKDALDKLVLAQKNMLDMERAKLHSMQNTEDRVRSNQDYYVEPKPNNLMISMRPPKIQRNYLLTSKASFEVWLDSLKTELTSWMLLYLIDPKLPQPTGLSEIEIALRKNSVKDIIISHIDEDYHKKILGLTEPMQILKKLRESRKGEVSSTPTSIRTRLYNLRMAKGERAHKFCERFDQIIREHELSDDPQKLSEQEKRSTFYQAIIEAMPEIRRTDTAVMTATGEEMNMESLRKAMLRIQEDNDAVSGAGNSEFRGPSASRVTSHKYKNSNNKCYRCNQIGHWQQNCPLIKSNRWFCYTCKQETDHQGDDCPFKGKRPPTGFVKRPFPRSSESFGPPAKRGKPYPGQGSRGRGSGNHRGNPAQKRGANRGHFKGGNRGGKARRVEYEQDDYGSSADNLFTGCYEIKIIISVCRMFMTRRI